METWEMFGTSVRGPSHAREHRPNQDAWRGCILRRYAIIVVSDGLGSRAESGRGAQAACRAACEAAATWVRFAHAEPRNLIRLIRVLWEMRLAPLKSADCAATCWVAIWLASGRLVVAGLGDGLALVRSPNGEVESFGRPESSFSNQTLSLGQPHSLTDWRVLDSDVVPGTIVVLATDGVADDLRPERWGDLVGWLALEVGALPRPERRRTLRRELRDWSTPSHVDDKTLAVLWRLEAPPRE